MHHHHNHRHYNNTTTTRRHGLFGRRVHHQQRKPTLKDKISGAMLKLKGSITGRPGEKVSLSQ
jgi:hypothetical protein